MPALTKRHIELFLERFNSDGRTGEEMYAAGFLAYCRHYKDVHCEFAKESNCHFLKGNVHAQMYKKVTYNVHVKLSEDGLIYGSHCECAAGEGGSAHCKHVHVVLLAVEDMMQNSTHITRKACTEELQTFHKPNKSYHGTPLKSKDLKHKSRTQAVQFDPRPKKYRDYDAETRLKNLITPLKSTSSLKALCKPENPYAIDNDHHYYCTLRLNTFLQSLYLVDVSDEDVVRIEKETRGQSKNPHWHEYRRFRLTASHFHDCCVFVSDNAGAALAQRLLNETKIFSDALVHGIMNENAAVQAHMSQYQGVLKEEECGLFLMKSKPYLGASPDRLLCKLTILEVKCPYTAKNCVINEFTVPYLVNDSGVLNLRKDHEYYYQIQGQLAVTGREFCDFIIYTVSDLKVLSLRRDEEFINNMLSKLDSFYEKCFLPALLQKYYYKDYYEIF